MSTNNNEEASMKVQMVSMSPAQAKGLLAANGRNRPLSARAVQALADAIRRGEWIANGDTIVVGSDGILLDGQHRLSAIVAAGMSVPTLLVTGAEPRSFMTIDTGGKGGRRGVDMLALAGEKNVIALQSAVTWVERYYTSNVLSTAFKLTPQQTAATLARNPGIRDAVNAYRTSPCERIVGTSAAAFFYLVSLVDRLAADRFMADLGEGAGLTSDDPVLVARNMLINERATGSGGTANATRTFLVLVRAWNARRAGMRGTPHSIKVKMTGARRTPDLDISGLPRVVVEQAAAE